MYQIDYEDGGSEWTQIPSDGIEVIDGPTGSAADALLAAANVAVIDSVLASESRANAGQRVGSSDPQVR